MIKIARFYQPNALDRNELVEGCGTDSVMHLDGRWGMAKQHMEASKECAKRGYKGYVLQQRANCASTPHPTSKLTVVPTK